jgi:hypothetical protein
VVAGGVVGSGVHFLHGISINNISVVPRRLGQPFGFGAQELKQGRLRITSLASLTLASGGCSERKQEIVENPGRAAMEIGFSKVGASGRPVSKKGKKTKLDKQSINASERSHIIHGCILFCRRYLHQRKNVGIKFRRNEFLVVQRRWIRV